MMPRPSTWPWQDSGQGQLQHRAKLAGVRAVEKPDDFAEATLGLVVQQGHNCGCRLAGTNSRGGLDDRFDVFSRTITA